MLITFVFIQDMSRPIVPEVSLIFEDTRKSVSGKETQPKSYKEWKQQQQQPQQCVVKLAPYQSSIADRKKIVTFDLPTDIQTEKKAPTLLVESTPIAACQQLDLSICEPIKSENIVRHSIPAHQMTVTQSKQPDYQHFVQHQSDKRMMMPSQPIVDEMYKRGSVPINTMVTPNQMLNNNTNNNQPSSASKDITLNEIYQLLHNMHVNNQPSNPMTNHQNDLNRLNAHDVGMENHRHIDHLSLVPGNLQASPNPSTPNNGEPTMRDMFTIVMRQQEQLMNIQSQVQALLMRPTNAIGQILGDANANVNQIDTKQVGVMTSLEINVQNYKPSAKQVDDNFGTPITRNKLANNQNIKSCGCMCNCNTQNRQHLSDSGSNDDNFDNNSPRQNESAGWTFYGNILNQVNDVLQSTSPVSSARPANENQSPQLINNTNNFPTGSNETPRRFSNVLPNIRTAKIKQVGFQIDDVNISAMTKR